MPTRSTLFRISLDEVSSLNHPIETSVQASDSTTLGCWKDGGEEYTMVKHKNISQNIEIDEAIPRYTLGGLWVYISEGVHE